MKHKRKTRTVLRTLPGETVVLYDMKSKTETDLQIDYSAGMMTVIIKTSSSVRIVKN